jgi:cell division protein FtsW (lipid II flippase)
VGVSSFLFGQSPRYYKILTVVSLLVLVGLIMVLSSSATDSIRNGNNGFTVFLSQGRSAILGVVMMVIASQLSFDWLRRQITLIFASAIGLQLITLVFGYSVGGNKNWLKIGPITLQPSEILKLAMILYLAEYLTQNHRDREFSKTWIKPTVMSFVAIGTVVLGSDLGTGLVMAAIMLGV